MDSENLWAESLTIIKIELNALAFQTWFEDTKIKSICDNLITILVPSVIHKQHLENQYKEVISSAIKKITNLDYELEFIIKTDDVVEENFTKYEEVKQERESNYINSNLNPNYNFDSFIVGKSNKFAHAAALSVAENPGQIYNPLFIYGNSGLGKTHLMHAIGNYIVNTSDKKVLYITSEQFVNDYVAINRKDKNGTNFDYVDYFKSKYREVDVLIIDDIQHLEGASATQKEFFQTFNTLHENNKQIIISSDSSPNDLKKLEDRLITRFSWGLTVDIFPPDFELRYEIVKMKIEGEGVSDNFPEDVIEYIANSISGNIRSLEGAVTRLFAYSTIMDQEIKLDVAKEALKDFVGRGTSDKNDITKIQKIVANYFKVSIDDLKSRKKTKKVTFPRQIAMYLSRKHTDESFPKIGSEFGGKDHSTVIHSCDKIEKEIKNNEEVKTIIKKLEEEI